jgi:hypothetical protein
METSQYIIVDIDGTIALRGERGPYDWKRVSEDQPNKPVINVIKAMNRRGYRIIFTSGRKEYCRSATIAWIEKHFDWGRLPVVYMRGNDDNRPDHEVKHEMFTEVIKPVWGTPAMVFDDRNAVVKMWRGLGLTCLQVADGDF